MNIHDLAKHIGHKIRVVSHGKINYYESIAIECETCDEVLYEERRSAG